MLATLSAACGSSGSEVDAAAGMTDATPATECQGFVRPFDVDTEQYPFDSCAFATESGTLHYVDAGPRDAAHTILLVHGNPTWSFLYRNIAKDLLSDGHRVVIPDHLGMGMSDVPSTSAFDYRPRSHADHLEDLVVALDLDNVTLVVQDWGGPIGLGMATKQPDRISRILIMNTWAWSVDADDPGDYHALINWYRQAKQAGQVLPEFFCSIALPGQSELNAAAADPTEGAIYDAVRAAYLAPAVDPVSGDYRAPDEPCAPMQIFAESIVDDNAFQAEVQARLDVLRGKPYALLFGLSDILFGALRCDGGTCPGSSTCTCDETLLPSRVEANCQTASAEFHVCLEPDDSPLQPYPDRFIELLGQESLVLREAVPESDHMIQEYVPDRVVEAVRSLVATSISP
jgi:haloalkane dehalogenase